MPSPEKRNNKVNCSNAENHLDAVETASSRPCRGYRVQGTEMERAAADLSGAGSVLGGGFVSSSTELQKKRKRFANIQQLGVTIFGGLKYVIKRTIFL